jgi:hypothetical protein
MNIIIQITTAAIHKIFERLFNFFSNVVVFSGASWRLHAIFHISVSIPIAVTTAFQRHFVIIVPLNTIFFMSASVEVSSTVAMYFSTGTLSPVKIASSTSKFTASKSLPSAGILSPASSKITSQIVNSLASTNTSSQSLKTLAFNPAIFFND